jgi:hypothetical protein
MSRQLSLAWLLMNASHASRCAWSELKSCFSPSSEDLRVYIAQRLIEGLAIDHLLGATLQTKEQRSRPASAGDYAGDFRRRLVAPTLVDDIIVEHGDPVIAIPGLAPSQRQVAVWEYAQERPLGGHRKHGQVAAAWMA